MDTTPLNLLYWDILTANAKKLQRINHKQEALMIF